MSKRWLATLALGVFLIALGFILRKSPRRVETPQQEVEVPRPSPLDEKLAHPALQMVPNPTESIRTRVAGAAKPVAKTESLDKVAGNNWAVVAAIYKDYDAAAKRARSMGADVKFRPTVFPEKGQGNKYMVLIGSGLTRAKAEELKIRAAAAGFPSDMYVTRLGTAD